VHISSLTAARAIPNDIFIVAIASLGVERFINPSSSALRWLDENLLPRN
jgi:hypothetical protein